MMVNKTFFHPYHELYHENYIIWSRHIPKFHPLYQLEPLHYIFSYLLHTSKEKTYKILEFQLKQSEIMIKLLNFLELFYQFLSSSIFPFSIHPTFISTIFLKSLWVSLSLKAQLLGCVFDTPDRDAQPITFYGGVL